MTRMALAAGLGIVLMVAACGGPASTAAPPSASATAEPSATATTPPTIHVLEDPVSWTGVPAGSASGCTDPTGCLGDRLVGRSRLLDATSHAEVGTFIGDCVLVDPAAKIYHCPANAITLTGRGQIVYTETPFCFGSITASPNCRGDWPIIGGTGEFLGATGHVNVPVDTSWKYGDFVITFRE